MWRRFVFRVVVKVIRKYFPQGISVIKDAEEDVIAYRWQWAWTKELEDECFGRK